MSWPTYLAFVAFAAVVVVAPGPDFAVVLKNTLAGGRRDGLLTSLGVTASCVVQGTAAALGVGAVIARSQPLFLGLRWAGAVYLCWLGVQLLRAAARRAPGEEPLGRPAVGIGGGRAFAQGFLSNITNPKVLVFYLSVLPQFLGRAGPATLDAIALAYTHAGLGVAWLLVVVTAVHRVRPLMRRRRVRRALDAATGSALVGFAAVLAVESR